VLGQSCVHLRTLLPGDPLQVSYCDLELGVLAFETCALELDLRPPLSEGECLSVHLLHLLLEEPDFTTPLLDLSARAYKVQARQA